jgi:hypothetical protein
MTVRKIVRSTLPLTTARQKGNISDSVQCNLCNAVSVATVVLCAQYLNIKAPGLRKIATNAFVKFVHFT